MIDKKGKIKTKKYIYKKTGFGHFDPKSSYDIHV